MKTFLLILFFSKFILLSPEPVSLHNEWIEITPKKTFTAITSGASIQIEIPVNDYRVKSIDKSKDLFLQLNKLFQPNSIQATLIDTDGNHINLTSKYFTISDFTLTNKDSIMLALTAKERIPTDIKFRSVRVKSESKINNVKIYWKNYRH